MAITRYERWLTWPSTRPSGQYRAKTSLRKAVGVARTLVDHPDYDACLAGVRGQMDGAAYSAAWTEGGAMAVEQAIAYTLRG